MVTVVMRLFMSCMFMRVYVNCVIACQGFSVVQAIALHGSVIWILWGILTGRLQTVTPNRAREIEKVVYILY